MRLRCPSCNAVHSVEAWVDEDFVVQALTTVAKLPREVAPLALRYAALFRPKGPRGLSWQKASRVLKELHELVTAGTVSWEGRELPASPEVWARALEIVLEAGIEPPLKNHNYLRHVAFEQAKKRKARAEAEAERRRAYPYSRQHDGSGPKTVGEALGASFSTSGEAKKEEPEEDSLRDKRRAAWEKLQKMSPTEKELLFERARMHPTANFLPLETVVINLLLYGEGLSGDRGDQEASS